MSLLDREFTGKLPDGSYTGAIKAYKAQTYQTDKGAQDAVVLTIAVMTAEYDFVLFEKPFEWALRDLSNAYFQGRKASARNILDALLGKSIAFSLYTQEYAGRHFQRLSFNPNYNVHIPDGEPEDLQFQ